MPKFSYKARDGLDKIVVGTLSGTSIDEIADRLSQKDCVPISIDELDFDGTRKAETWSEKWEQWMLRRQTTVSMKTIVFFTRQLATMLDGGVPLARALEQLGRGESSVFRRILAQVAEDIARGSSLSEALSSHPGSFNHMYVSVIHAGEVAGALDVVLDQMATYLETQEAMRAKVKGAMRYPLFIGAFITLIVVGILWKLVPTFENLYSSMGGVLPASTRILIMVSHAVRDHLPLVIGGLMAAFIGLRIGMTYHRVRLFLDRMILHFPVFGMILKKNIWATYCRTMALLLESGTPILQATEIAGGVVGNKKFARSMECVYADLMRGELLSASLERTGVFPPLISQLASTGEQSGKVGPLLRKAAEFFEREIKVTVDSLAAILEPFLIIVLGGAVGSILIALYLPIFSIGKLFMK